VLYFILFIINLQIVHFCCYKKTTLFNTDTQEIYRNYISSMSNTQSLLVSKQIIKSFLVFINLFLKFCSIFLLHSFISVAFCIGCTYKLFLIIRLEKLYWFHMILLLVLTRSIFNNVIRIIKVICFT